MLKDKYQDLLNLANTVNIRNAVIREDGGKLQIKGAVAYQADKDHIWTKIKSYPGWENEIGADISVEKADIYGIYTVQPGDTLSKISKVLLHSPNRYMEIFNINKDVLSNPDLIKVGQKLKIPNR